MTTEKRITELLESTNREGVTDLVCYLRESGFFECPASTKFHGAHKGGLAEHSLRVYELLDNRCGMLNLGRDFSPGQKPLEITEEAIVIAALLHDVCKVGAYIGDESPYKWNKQQPKGHALLSIERIKKHIELTELEELMIKYHMGVYGLNEFYEEDSWEYKTSAEYPLRGDHSKCEGMTKEESQKARYGKSLRNAWYHNPIVKLMYFCDELAVFEEKAKNEVPATI